LYCARLNKGKENEIQFGVNNMIWRKKEGGEEKIEKSFETVFPPLPSPPHYSQKQNSG